MGAEGGGAVRWQADGPEHPTLRRVTSAAAMLAGKARLSSARPRPCGRATGALRTDAPYQQPTAMPHGPNLPPVNPAGAGGGKFFRVGAGKDGLHPEFPPLPVRHTRC